MSLPHSSIDCKQNDCPYYGHYAGDSNDDFYVDLGLSKVMVKNDIEYTRGFKNEVDLKIRATCNMCLDFPQKRMDMKSWVIKEAAKRLLKNEMH